MSFDDERRARHLTPGAHGDPETSVSAPKRARRPIPTTAAEHRAEALRCIEMSFSPFGYGIDYMKRARHHVEAALLMDKIEAQP